MPGEPPAAAPWLEIVLPVRNPGRPLLETVASLTAQTVRGFGVLLSDNHSTSGAEILAEGCAQLERAGIPVAHFRPPFELGRVEHWNRAHHAARAVWLKPLFVGDLLAPAYVERLAERVREAPAAQVVRCHFLLSQAEGVFPAALPPTGARALTPRALLRHYPGEGNWLGGPVNFAYTRTAWQAAGGYPVQLPACADLSLYTTLALRHGLELLPEALATFQLHAERFSMGMNKRRILTFVELSLILRQARAYGQAAGLPWPAFAITKAIWRQIRIDHLQPLKRRLLGHDRG